MDKTIQKWPAQLHHTLDPKVIVFGWPEIMPRGGWGFPGMQEDDTASSDDDDDDDDSNPDSVAQN